MTVKKTMLEYKFGLQRFQPRLLKAWWHSRKQTKDYVVNL